MGTKKPKNPTPIYWVMLGFILGVSQYDPIWHIGVPYGGAPPNIWGRYPQKKNPPSICSAFRGENFQNNESWSLYGLDCHGHFGDVGYILNGGVGWHLVVLRGALNDYQSPSFCKGNPDEGHRRENRNAARGPRIINALKPLNQPARCHSTPTTVQSIKYLAIV